MKGSSHADDSGRAGLEKLRRRMGNSMAPVDALLAEMLSLIRKEMQVQGMTLGDLARESKLGLRTVERYFSPALKSPEWYTLEQLARGVGKTLCYIQRRAHLRLLPPHKA